MAVVEQHDVDSPGEGRGWSSHLDWLVLLLLGWALYGLTTRPEVGAVTVCAKFGLEDFRAALWLRRRDPWPYRGRTCFWLYLSFGLLKTATVAAAVCIGSLVVQVLVSDPEPGPEALFGAIAGALLAHLVSLGFAALSLAYALFLAWRGHIPLWLGRVAYRARRLDTWPPGGAAHGKRNGILAVLFGVSLLLGYAVSIAAMVLFRDSLNALLVGLGAWGLIPLSLTWANMLAIALWLSRHVARRLMANHPLECWGSAGPEDPAIRSSKP
jgi:hypothetical protein